MGIRRSVCLERLELLKVGSGAVWGSCSAFPKASLPVVGLGGQLRVCVAV